jgi:putative oxidoreductase
VRRLFSSFAHGAPGAGLLLMRIAAGGALVVHGVAGLAAGSAAPSVALDILSAVTGVLLLVGLWTPVVAALATIDAALLAFSDPANQRFYILLGALAAALALLGPGAFSVDARLFGWRRVEIRNGNGNGNRNQKRRDPPPI